MDFGPIFESRHVNVSKTLHIGAVIRYEVNDAEYLVHILRFLETYRDAQGQKFTLMPAITHHGHNADAKMDDTYIAKAETLLAQFEKLKEGQRLILGVISIHFLDEMRPVFEAYHETLREIRHKAEDNYNWDELHPFFILNNHFESIARLFFPNKTTMN